MKKSILAVFSVIVITSISTNYAFAYTRSGETVTMAGLDNGVNTFVGISPNPEACTTGGVYFVDSNTRSAALSVAMAALLSGKKVRVDYNTSTSGSNITCIGYGIYIIP